MAAVAHGPSADWWGAREAGVFEAIRFIASGSVPNTLAKWRQQIIPRVPDANRAGPLARPALDAALGAYLRELHEAGDIRMQSEPARLTVLQPVAPSRSDLWMQRYR